MPAERTGDGFISIVDLFEEFFSGLIVLKGLLIGVEASGEVAIPLLDVLVAGILLQMQDLVGVLAHN